MKTIEEKAAAYDEVIRRAKIALDCCDSASIATKNTIYDILPELQESEDERMWKLIKKYAHSNISDMALNADHITRKQLESWLESQSHKSVWTDNDRVMAFTILRDIEQMTTISKEGKNERLQWLDSLGDRF